MSDMENQHEKEAKLTDSLEQSELEETSDEFDVSSLLNSSTNSDSDAKDSSLVNEDLQGDDALDYGSEVMESEALKLGDSDLRLADPNEEETEELDATEELDVSLEVESEDNYSQGDTIESSMQNTGEDESSESNFDPISGEFSIDDDGSEDDAWIAAPSDSDDDALEIGDDGSFSMPEEIKLDAEVEAIIFASEKSIKVSDIVEIIADEEVTSQEVQDIIKSLQQFYEERGGGFRLEHVRGGGYQFRTVAAAGSLMERMFASRPRPISRAAQETLAIVAYRQPVTRADVEFIRGVDAGSIMKNLLERDLIKCVGRKDDAGRPMIFGTTDEFLRVYQLTSLKDLPSLDSFQPSPENMRDARDVIEGDKEVDVEDFIKDADKEETQLNDEDTNMKLSSQENDEEFMEDNDGPFTGDDLSELGASAEDDSSKFKEVDEDGALVSSSQVQHLTSFPSDIAEVLDDENDELLTSFGDEGDEGDDEVRLQEQDSDREQQGLHGFEDQGSEDRLLADGDDELDDHFPRDIEGAVSAQPVYSEQVDQSLVEEDNQIEGVSDGTNSVTEVDIPAGDRVPEGSGKMDS